MLEKVYSGSEIDVFSLNKDKSSEKIIIYFDHLGGRKSNLIKIEDSEQRAQLVASAFGRLDFMVVIVISLRGYWYQNDETELILRKLLVENAKSEFYHIGYSMGGFGAINFACINNAKVLAFQPQVSLGSQVPMTRAYEECYSKLLNKFRSNIINGSCSAVQGYVFYDNQNEIDTWHSSKIITLTKLKGIVVPYAGHGTSSVINRYYRLYLLLDDFIRNKFDQDVFYNKVKVMFTDEFISHKLKQDIDEVVLSDVFKQKSLASKLKICYSSGVLEPACKEILKISVDKNILSYDLLKLIIQILLKNRNFYDLVSFLDKVILVVGNSSEKIKNLVYLGKGIALHCEGRRSEGDKALLMASSYNNTDYYNLWHLNKFMSKNNSIRAYLRRNANHQQIKLLNID